MIIHDKVRNPPVRSGFESGWTNPFGLDPAKEARCSKAYDKWDEHEK